MKINPITNPNILQSYRTSKTAQKELSVSYNGADEVSFSSEALNFSKLMSGIKENLEATSPTQQARLAEIKTAVQDGTYRVDSDRIAESMLRPPYQNV